MEFVISFCGVGFLGVVDPDGLLAEVDGDADAEAIAAVCRRRSATVEGRWLARSPPAAPPGVEADEGIGGSASTLSHRPSLFRRRCEFPVTLLATRLRGSRTRSFDFATTSESDLLFYLLASLFLLIRNASEFMLVFPRINRPSRARLVPGG